MSLDRVLRNTQAELSVTFYGDEAALSADGAVTVDLIKADGTALLENQATSNPGVGQYKYILAPQSDLMRLTVVWTGTFSGVVQSITTYVEVVGGRYYALAEARASDSSLASTDRYPTSELEQVRLEVEDEFEEICEVAFVPRFGRETISGNGRSTLMLRRNKIRRIISLTVGSVAFSAENLSALSINEIGEIYNDGSAWSSGIQNIVVEYEYGYDAPPSDVRRAALIRQRHRLMANKSGVPDRAVSYSAAEGGTYSLATPGRAGFETGIPEVDAVLKRYSWVVSGIA